MDFKIGDVVILKSGGPNMTITKIEDSICYLVWFDKNDIKNTGQFEAFFLKKAKGSRPMSIGGML
jgi:uncharacterized protein YodC (DUF2158 family)